MDIFPYIWWHHCSLWHEADERCIIRQTHVQNTDTIAHWPFIEQLKSNASIESHICLTEMAYTMYKMYNNFGIQDLHRINVKMK